MSASDLICSACLAPEADWAGSAKARCGHSMCLPCCLTWSKSNASCPECRASFAPSAPEPRQPVPAWTPTPEAELLRAHDQAEMRARDQAAMQAWAVRDQAHRARVAASAARREIFLQQTRADWASHLTTCTDAACMATHIRRTNWLDRGRLVPQPAPVSSLGRTMIGLLMAAGRMSSNKQRTVCRYTEMPSSRRMMGFMYACHKQQETARFNAGVRAQTAGAVSKRHGTSLAVAKATLSTFTSDSNPGVKVFKGFTLPKRGARTGDLYITATDRAVCVGHNLWHHADGSRSRLVKHAWTTTPAIDFEALD